MAENVTAELAAANITEMQPPGANADALIAEMAQRQVAEQEAAGGAGAGDAGNPLPPVSTDAGGQTSFIPSAAPAMPPGFDPELHETNPDGSPALTVEGAFKKRRGRKPQPKRDAKGHFAPRADSAVLGPEPAAGVPSPALTSLEAPPRQISHEEAAAAAAMLVGLAISGAIGVFGEEWHPDPADKHPLRIDEQASLTAAVGEWMYEENIGLSSGKAALMFSAMYAGRRVSRPATKAKLAAWLGPVWRWVRGVFVR